MKKHKTIPPALAQKILLRFLRVDLAEEVLGDLDEKFYINVQTKSPFKAKINYWYQVLHYLRPFAIRKSNPSSSNAMDMFQNYFKIGWRNLLKNKGYSFINVGGLAIGMAVAILIGIWVYDELQFNKYHKNYKNIARVLRHGTANGETFTNSSLPYALGEELKSKYDNSFEHVVMAWHVGDHILSTGGKKISMTGEFMESGGPEMFSLKMIHGSWSGLDDPHSILLSQSAATLLFGNDNPMDKLLKIDSKMDVKVTGVYEDLPHNTHFHGVKFFSPWDLMVISNDWIKYQGFKNNFLAIYVAISEHTTFEKASSRIKDAILNNIQDDKVYVSINPQIFLHPMEKWHLFAEWKNGINTGGLIDVVWLFGIIGVCVLLLACINFMNLSTARSEKRAKEVGIRKAIGSIRRQLIHQFFSESFLVVLLSFAGALILVSASLTWFNDLASKQMEIPWNNGYFWLGSFFFLLLTGIVSASYPALYLSSFNPVQVLKGSVRVGRSATVPRKILVVLQFTVSGALIIGTIIVYQQILFAQNRPVGYSRDGLLMIQMTSPDFHGKYDVLRTALLNTGAVTEIAESSGPPTDVWNSNGGFDWQGKDPAFIAEFATMTVTPGYGKTVGWQFVKGKDFVEGVDSDSSGFVLNEAAAALLSFENPIGEVIRWNSPYGTNASSFTVIGVIKDMVMKSPYSEVQPTVFYLGDNRNWINIRINPQTSVSDAVAKIEIVFKKLIPAVPFDYKFADEEYALKFAAEKRIGKLASVFSVLAIVISCLGLFGLASFVAEQRTKEIGIRKVVGASVYQLWSVLSKDFVILVLISSFIASPLAYYYVNNWLQQYQYRTEISWWFFGITTLGILMITLLTVSFQAIKAAMMNPVKSLRSE